MAKFYTNLSLENYKKAMSGQYQNSGISADNISTIDDNTISVQDNIKNAISVANTAITDESDNHDDDNTWFEKIGNFFGTIYHGIQEGVLNFADGIGDAVMGTIGAIGGAFGNNELEETMSNAIQYDWQSQAIQAGNALTGSVFNAGRAIVDPNYSWEDYQKEWTDIGNSENSRENLNNEKYGTDLSSGVMDTISGVSQGVGQILPAIATGQVLGGALSGATGLSARTANIVTQATTGFTQGVGGGYNKALNNGGSLSQGTGYAYVKGLLGASKSALSASVYGTLSDQAQNIVGEKVATRVLGSTGKETLANFAGNIASIATDVAMDSGLDFGEELLDPVISQLYDDNAIANAYGDDNWKETLANAGKVALTSALTSFIVDSTKAVVGQRRTNFVDDTKTNLEIEEDNKAIKQAKKEMQVNGDEETLKRMEELNEQSKANLESVKNETEIFKKVADEYSKNPSEENKEKMDIQGQKVRDTINKASEIAEVEVQRAKDYIEINNQTKSNQDIDKTLLSKTPNKRDKDIVERKYANTLEKREAYKAELEQYQKDLDSYNERKAKAEANKEDFTEKKPLKPKSKTNDWVDMGSDIKAKIDTDNKIVYKAKNVNDIQFLLNQSFNDDSNGRKVILNKEFVNTKANLQIDTTKVTTADIDSLSKAITDTTENYMTTYVNQDTKDTILQSSNGTMYSFKNGVYQGITTSKPQWATESTIQLYETRSNYFKNDMRLIQQASKIGYTGEKSTIDFIDEMTKHSGFIATNAKDTSGESWTRKTATAYNMATDENERSLVIEGAVNELLDNNSSLNFTYKDIEGKNKTVTASAKTLLSNEDVATLKTDLKNMLDSTQRHTEGQNMTTEYRTNLSKLASDFNKLQKATDNLIKQRKAYDSLQKRIERAGTKKTSASQPYEKMNAYVLQYGSLKLDKSTGMVSTDSLGKLLKTGVVDTIDDNGNKTTTKIDYSLEGLRKVGLEDLFDQSTADTLDELSSHFNDNGEYLVKTLDENGNEIEVVSDRLSIEDNEALTGILSRVNKMASASDLKIRTERKSKYMPLILASESLQYAQQVKNKVQGTMRRAINSTLGFHERFNILFGKGSEAYNLLVTEPQLDRQQSAFKKNELVNDMSVIADKHNINLETKGSENVSFDYDGTSYKIKKGEAMQLYLNSLSPDNLAKLTNDGWTTTENGAKVKHNALSFGFFDNLKNNVLSSDEVAFVDDLFNNCYNGKTKDTLNNYTEEKYGFKMFTEDNYVHRSISDTQQVSSLPDILSSSFKNKAESLNATIAIKRTRNGGAMEIGDIFQAYDSYCEQVADFVSLDHIRELNTALNMRGSQDYVSDNNGNPQPTISYDENGNETTNYQRAYSATSVVGNFGLYEGGKQFIDSWVKAINGYDTKGYSGKMMRIFQNAQATAIGFNPGTYFKMFLDPIRLAGKEVVLDNGEVKRVGWKNIFEGMLNFMNSKTRDGTLESYSTYWAKSNQDKFAINSNIYGAQLSGWKNKLFYEPLEKANNAMMKHIMFPALQSFAKSVNGGELTSETNTKMALELFDTLSVTTLSNGDSLDVSDLRSGRAGALTQAVFGTFGGDSQKKAEQVTDVVLGNSRSKRRVEGYTRIINKYNQTLTEYEQRVTEAQAKYDKVKAKYDEVDIKGNHTKKTSFDVLMAENELNNAISQREALKNALDSTQKNIDFEKNVVQSVGSQMKKAGYVLSALVVTAVLENSINAVTDLAKNKDDELKADEFFKDVGQSAFVDWIPYIGTIANSVQYATSGNVDLTPLQLQGFVQSIEAGKGIFDLIGNDNGTTDYGKAFYNAVVAMGTNMGVPIKNMMDYFVGATTRINEVSGGGAEWANTWREIIKGYSSSTLSSKTSTMLEQGNLSKATEYTQANMAFFKSGNVSWDLAKELASAKASVSTIPDEYTGEVRDTFMSMYNKVNGIAEKYIKKNEYRSLSSSEEKGKALSTLFKGYFYMSKAITSEDETLLQGSLSKALYAYYSGQNITTEQRKLLKKYGII